MTFTVAELIQVRRGLRAYAATQDDETCRAYLDLAARIAFVTEAVVDAAITARAIPATAEHAREITSYVADLGEGAA